MIIEIISKLSYQSAIIRKKKRLIDKARGFLMTYGEYYYLIKYDMRLMNGVWIANKPRVTIPTKMKRDEAMIYYNKKFAKFWISEKEKETTE